MTVLQEDLEDAEPGEKVAGADLMTKDDSSDEEATDESGQDDSNEGALCSCPKWQSWGGRGACRAMIGYCFTNINMSHCL